MAQIKNYTVTAKGGEAKVNKWKAGQIVSLNEYAAAKMIEKGLVTEGKEEEKKSKSKK